MEKIGTGKRIAMVICVAILLTACGQKGDLYLPEGSALISWIG